MNFYIILYSPFSSITVSYCFVYFLQNTNVFINLHILSLQLRLRWAEHVFKISEERTLKEHLWVLMGQLSTKWPVGSPRNLDVQVFGFEGI